MTLDADLFRGADDLDQHSFDEQAYDGHQITNIPNELLQGPCREAKARFTEETGGSGSVSLKLTFPEDVPSPQFTVLATITEKATGEQVKVTELKRSASPRASSSRRSSLAGHTSFSSAAEADKLPDLGAERSDCAEAVARIEPKLRGAA
jgi:hypothetical protein